MHDWMCAKGGTGSKQPSQGGVGGGDGGGGGGVLYAQGLLRGWAVGANRQEGRGARGMWRHGTCEMGLGLSRLKDAWRQGLLRLKTSQKPASKRVVT